MNMVTLAEATTQLPALVERAAQGHDVVISVDGVPLVRLTRMPVKKRTVRFGVLKGRLVVPPDFDEPLPAEVLVRFEGEGWPG